jgi:hypothetical protein
MLLVLHLSGYPGLILRTCIRFQMKLYYPSEKLDHKISVKTILKFFGKKNELFDENIESKLFTKD